MRAKRAETEAKRAETEWNIEKERLALLSDSSDGNAAGFNSGAGKEMRHLLPRVSDIILTTVFLVFTVYKLLK